MPLVFLYPELKNSYKLYPELQTQDSWGKCGEDLSYLAVSIVRDK